MALKNVTARPFPTVSRLDPAVRLFCLLCLSAVSLGSSREAGASLVLIASVLVIGEGLPLRKLIKSDIIIIIFAASFACLGIIAGNKTSLEAYLLEDVSFFIRLLAAYSLGLLYYTSTTTTQLREGSNRLLQWIPGLREKDIGLAFALMLGYIPMIVDEYRASLEAARSRGFPHRPSPALYVDFISAFLRRLMLRALSVPEALLSRGWARGQRTAKGRLGAMEITALTLTLCFVFVVLLKLV